MGGIISEAIPLSVISRKLPRLSYEVRNKSGSLSILIVIIVYSHLAPKLKESTDRGGK